MKKKADLSEPEREPKNDRWLLTYSDMITLLLALFIILYSMSNIENDKLKALAEGFSSVFKTVSNTGNAASGNVDYSALLNVATSASGTKTSSTATSGTATNGTSTVSNVNASVGPLDEVYQTLNSYIKENHLQDEIGLVSTDTYVSIHLKGMFMFQPDTAVLLNSSKPVIKEIGTALIKVYGKVDHITISGHTADVGEHTKMTDEVSWQLSLDRADIVRKSFVDFGLGEDKISIEGYAHYKPIASNSTEAGRAQNRRVEISVYKYTTDNSGTSNASGSSAASVSAK